MTAQLQLPLEDEDINDLLNKILKHAVDRSYYANKLVILLVTPRKPIQSLNETAAFSRQVKLLLRSQICGLLILNYLDDYSVSHVIK